MEDIISKVIEVEHEAAGLIAEAHNSEKKILDEINFEIEVLRKKIIANTQKKIQAIKKNEEDDLKEKIKKIDDEFKIQEAKLVKFVEERLSGMEKEIMDELIKPE